MVTDHDKLKSAIRELKLRKRVYPRFVSAGRMTGEEMRHEIAVMEAIVADYQQKVQPSLLT